MSVWTVPGNQTWTVRQPAFNVSAPLATQPAAYAAAALDFYTAYFGNVTQPLSAFNLVAVPGKVSLLCWS